jgi:type I restriction enzyme S subunit
MRLEKQCRNIDKIVNKLNNKITLFTEYRTSLISDVVAGKVDIRSVVVPEYESIRETTDANMNDEVITTENEDVTTKIISFPTVATKSKGHNQHFDDAVMIAGIVDAFYSEKYPLGRKKVQKLLYLLRRYQEESVVAFKKKAAGPYADEVRYKGGEPIARKNKYIVTTTTKGKGTTFAKGEKIAQALEYIKKWNMQSDIQWIIDKFHYIKVDDLELLATVDMAVCDLNEAGIPVSVSSIKNLIATNKEWKAKLKKQTFSDIMIVKAISELEKLLERNEE